MTVKLIVMYDGALFSGYERQTDKRTVQGELETALNKLYGMQISTTASGRTDAGVHALGQAVSFDVLKEMEPVRIRAALNNFLPSDMRIKSAEYAPEGFNARKSAKQKTYFYDFYAADNDNPLLFNRALRLDKLPDTGLMREGAALFIGEHDFTNFYCLGSSAKTTVRTVCSCRILSPREVYGEDIYRLEITANGFLYKMVRLIAGALLRLGEKKLTLSELSALINCTSDAARKIPAPACGLYLAGVEYNKE